MSSNYFQPYKNYFWEWEEQGNVLAIPDGSTIAYRESLHSVFKEVAKQGLPTFGSLLLAVIALNTTGKQDLDKVEHILEQYSHFEYTKGSITIEDILEQGGHLETSYIVDSLTFLRLLSSIPDRYKTGQMRIVLLKAIFENCHNVQGIKVSTVIAGRYINRVSKEAIISNLEVTKKSLDHDLKPLALLNRKYHTVKGILERIAGVLELEEEIVLEETSTQEPQDFIAELINNPKTNKIGSLVKTIWAGLNLPVHSAIKSDQAMGGVSDLTNKGNYDRLLISEFANDDLVFLSRLANNEALYLSKESPPVTNDLKRVILIDISLKNWGTPKLVALAIMTAISNLPNSNVTCELFLIGDEVYKVENDSIEGLIDAIQIVEPCLGFSHGLTTYFEEHVSSEKIEHFVITERSTDKEASVARIFSEFKDQINYLIKNDAQGEVDIYRNLKSGKKHLQHLVLNLEQIWSSNKTKQIPQKESKIKEDSFYPITVRQSNSSYGFRRANNGEIFQLTKDRCLLRLQQKGVKSYEKGWEIIHENLPNSIKDFAIGVLPNGHYILLLFIQQTKEVTLLNLNTKEEKKVGFHQWWGHKESGFVFLKDCFFYGNKNISWQISVLGEVSKSEVIPETLFESQKKENPSLEIQYGATNGVFKNITDVGINENGNLQFNIHEFVLNEGNHIKLDSRLNNDLFITTSRTVSGNISTFVFDDGSEVIANRNGIIKLRSSDVNLPTIYIPSALGGTLGIATATEFAGNQYFKNEPKYDIHLMDAGEAKLAVVKYVKSITGLGLKASKEMIDGTPSSLMLNVSTEKLNEYVSFLDDLGTSVDVTSYDEAFTKELKVIPEQDFFKKYVYPFIQQIRSYGT